MPKWSIRDLWGKRTEKKTLNPEMRNMLLSLDGVYEPKAADGTPEAEAERVQDDTPRESTG